MPDIPYCSKCKVNPVRCKRLCKHCYNHSRREQTREAGKKWRDKNPEQVKANNAKAQALVKSYRKEGRRK